MIDRLSSDRGVFLLVVALLATVTVLVALLGWYDDVLRAFWDLF